MKPALSFACPDWADKLARGETPIADLPLDKIEAGAAIALFDKLRVPDIPGQPTMGEAAGDWVRDIIGAAFGLVHFEDDPNQPGEKIMLRDAGELFILVPKKNAKTTNAAAIGLVALMMNQTPNIDGVIIGPTQEVADKCFAQACAMIEVDDYLRRRFKVIDHKKTIIDREMDEKSGRPRNARLKVKSFDPKVVTGSIPAFAILDELHVMAESHYAGRVIGQIRGGMITNPQSLLIFITTQSEVIPAGVFKDELEYARRVRDGEVTEGVRMLPVLYEMPLAVQASDDKAWRDQKNWPMVLPNLHRSVRLDRLQQEYQQAMDKGPAEEARWASQHLNIQIGVGLHRDRWPGALFWQAATLPGLTLDGLIERCDVCVAGIDGGGLDDLMALGVIGRHRQSRAWLHWARAWAHPEVFELRKEIAPRLRDFIRDGDLVEVLEPDQDVIEVADICLKLFQAGLFPEKSAIGLDAYGVASVLDALAERGMEGDLLNAVGQGYKLQSAITTLPRKLKDKTFRHCGSPMMAWVVGNAKTELKGSNHVVTKAAAGSAKIDPLMATFNAAMLMFGNPVAALSGSYLDSDDLVVL